MKKFVSMLMMSLVVVSVFAYDLQVAGIYYDLNNSDMTAMVTSSVGNSYSGEIVIPESIYFNDKTYTVNTIKSYAFYNCNNLSNVIIPNSVTAICSFAFQNCSNLKSINLPEKLSYIDEGVFKGSGLTSITLPKSVTYIYYEAFYGCTDLNSVTISDNVNCIDENAFYGCTNLSEVIFPNRDVIIRGGAFSCCTNLSSLNIPNEVTYIGVNAFNETAWYKQQADGIVYAGKVAYKYKGYVYNSDITIKDGTRGIASGAFEGCYWLTTVNIPNSVVSIGWNAFKGTAWYDNQPDGLIYAGNVVYNYKGAMAEGSEIILKAGTTGIACSAFANCSRLVSIKLPNSLLNIGQSAFFNCSGLYSITIPNSVTRICTNAFGYCNGLTSVTIGSNFCISGGREFYGCNNLSTVIVNRKIPISINWATFYGADKTKCVIYVPIGCKGYYLEAAYWSEFENIVEYGEDPDTDISTLDNALYVEKTKVRIGGSIDIPVKLKNDFDVRGFVFTMELPEGATINNWSLSSSRLPEGATLSDKISTQKIDGNKITVACTLNYEDATFTGNDGEIATVNVSFANNMEVGEYPIYLTACDISDAGGTDNKLNDIKATLVLEDYVEGDANGDGVVLIGDVIAILNYIVGVTSNNFNEKAADVNGDGEILIGDVIAVLNIIVSQ